MIGRRKTGLHLGMARLYERKGKRVTTYYTITHDNRYIGLGHDLREAKKRLLELDGEPARAGTLAEHLDDLMAERRRLADAGKLSRATLESNVLEVAELKKAFGKMQPEAVRPKHVWEYLHKYRGAESPVRANREIALFSRLFNRLMSAGVLDTNPCVGVERNEEQARDRLITEQELDAFLTFLRKGFTDQAGTHHPPTEARIRVSHAAEIAYLTSKAQGQILRLQRSQITPDGIRFASRKRGVRTLVEWTPRLRDAIAAAQAMTSRTATLFVIYNAAGQPYTSSGFKSIWQRAMTDWVSIGGERFTFHDIRAKAVTDLIEDGRNVKDLTGHADDKTINKVYDRRRERRGRAVR